MERPQPHPSWPILVMLALAFFGLALAVVGIHERLHKLEQVQLRPTTANAARLAEVQMLQLAVAQQQVELDELARQVQLLKDAQRANP